MPTNSGSPFTQASQNAKALAAEFSSAGIGVTAVALTTLQTVSAFAHGLGSAPDFVIATVGAAVPAVDGDNFVSWVATATTITLSTGNTESDKTIAVMYGDLA